MMKQSIMIVGVGGQGTLLSSKIIGKAALEMGYDVKISEVHGMAQRGGSVVTYVKFGEKVFSPLIEEGEADVILSFEKLEALRYAKYLKQGGKIIINTQQINPSPVILGVEKYNDNIIESLTEKNICCISVDAVSLAKQSGSLKSVNIALLGVLASKSKIPESVWHEAIKAIIPAKTIEFNMKAFSLGYNFQSEV